MAHYAFLDENNIVTEVIVGRNEDEIVDAVSDWEKYYSEFRGQRCLRTSYNTFAGQHFLGGQPFRGNYAGIGMVYEQDIDAFVSEKPFNSWLLNEETYTWEAPIQIPEENMRYAWDEEANNWIAPSATEEN